MNLLILNPSAEDYKKILGPKFPELTIHSAIKEEEIGDFIGKAEILLTNRISDALMKKAFELQWIQASKASVSAKVAGVDVARVAAFAGSGGVITGRLGGQIDLRADAGAPDVVFRTAGGRAKLAIKDGTVPGLDLVGPVILAFGKPDASKASRGSNTFSSLGGTFTLSGGVLRSDDLAMASRDVDLKGRGTLRVAGAVVNLKADLILSEALSSQAGRDLYRYAREGSRVVLPATVTGAASPSVSIDIGAAAGRALRNTLEDQLRKGLGKA